jgi:hypothetical protein
MATMKESPQKFAQPQGSISTRCLKSTGWVVGVIGSTSTSFLCN